MFFIQNKFLKYAPPLYICHVPWFKICSSPFYRRALPKQHRPLLLLRPSTMTTVFVKVLTSAKEYTSRLGYDMFRTMVAVKGEKRGLPLTSPRDKKGEFAQDRFLSLTQVSKGDTSITLSAATVVRNLLYFVWQYSGQGQLYTFTQRLLSNRAL